MNLASAFCCDAAFVLCRGACSNGPYDTPSAIGIVTLQR